MHTQTDGQIKNIMLPVAHMTGGGGIEIRLSIAKAAVACVQKGQLSPNTKSSGVAMGCAGCAMHKGPAVRDLQWNQFFAFRYRMWSNQLKSTVFYTYSLNSCVSIKRRLNDQIVDLVTNRHAIHTMEVVLTIDIE